MARQIVDVFGKADPTQPAIRTQVPNSHERFNAATSFAESFGKFPKPLVCLVEGDRWLVLDGHHRLAAMFMLKEHENFPFDAWVGTHAP